MAIRDPWIRALVIVMLLIASVYLTGMLWQVGAQFADVILLFFLAWIVSFIIEPLVATLHLRARLPRSLAVLTTYLAVLVAVSIAIVQLVPRLSEQLMQVSNDLPLYAERANRELLGLQSHLAGRGILIAPETLFSENDVVRHVEAIGPLLLANALGIAAGVANLLFQFFIILILSYYMTLDGQRLSGALLLAMPASYRDDALYLLASVNRAFAGFMRGQLAQAAIYGVLTALVMSVVGLDFVLLSSLTAALFMLLPFIGPFLAMLFPLVVSAVTKPDTFWPLLLALFVAQQIVVNVVAPRLMSQTVGLHPLLVFLAFLGGAKVAGVWGALFGVPIVAVAAAMVSFYRATVEDRRRRLLDATEGLGETELEVQTTIQVTREVTIATPSPDSPEAAQAGGMATAAAGGKDAP